MPFKAGISGNPTGKKPGTQNKTTRELKAHIQQIVELELSKLPEILNSLPAKDRVQLLAKLIDYVLPKFQPDWSSQYDTECFIIKSKERPNDG